MRIAFLSPPVQGRLNPMTALARQLQSRNHDVVFMTLLDAEPAVHAAGLPFVGEPLIYASMGTVVNGVAEAFRTIAAAAAKRKGTQLVLSVGPYLDPEQIGPVPSNAIIVRRAPQLEVLEHASVCITHDQPGVAARIAHKKTGLFVPLQELTASRLSLLLDEVLNGSTYHDNARYFQEVIAETNGLLREDPASGMSEIWLGGVTKPLWTYSRFPSKSPVKDADGITQTPENSGLMPGGDGIAPEQLTIK
jgi:UDP:flavonoid glycosyltransferase YjiC (YdhE family)